MKNRLLDGKVAIVTGAGRGIGRGEAIELADLGAKVVVNDLGTSTGGKGSDRRVAEDVVDLIKARGGEAVADFEDVSSWDGAGRLIEHAVSAFGHLNVLVNNAAIFRDATIEEATETDWDDVVRVHMKGAFAPMHHAAVYWRKEFDADRFRNGSIINTTSRAGLNPSQGQIVRPGYVAAKAGIAALTMVASYELYEIGVRVNALAPSGYTRRAAETFSLGRSREPDEYAEYDPVNPGNNAPVVAWLASDKSLHVTGQVFRLHYGNTIIHMEPWQYGQSISTEGRWNAADIGPMMDMRVFGSREGYRGEGEEEMVKLIKSRTQS